MNSQVWDKWRNFDLSNRLTINDAFKNTCRFADKVYRTYGGTDKITEDLVLIMAYENPSFYVIESFNTKQIRF